MTKLLLQGPTLLKDTFPDPEEKIRYAKGVAICIKSLEQFENLPNNQYTQAVYWAKLNCLVWSYKHISYIDTSVPEVLKNVKEFLEIKKNVEEKQTELAINIIVSMLATAFSKYMGDIEYKYKVGRTYDYLIEDLI